MMLKSLTLLLGLFLAALLALLSLELYLRLFTKVSINPDFIRTHPKRRYELKPNFRGKTYSAEVRINSLGMRDAERPISDSAYKIAVFGDSMTFGISVESEETFPKILEKKLNDDFCENPTVQVFNLAVPSYNTVQEYRYMRDIFGVIKPDMVIVEFTAQNDTVSSADVCSGINRCAPIRHLKDVLRRLYSYNFLAMRFYGL